MRRKQICEAHVVGLGKSVPYRSFKAGFGVSVATHRPKQRRDMCWMFDRLTDDTRNGEIFEDMESRSNGFRTVAGI